MPQPSPAATASANPSDVGTWWRRRLAPVRPPVSRRTNPSWKSSRRSKTTTGAAATDSSSGSVSSSAANSGCATGR
nr:hypothetical protein [Actinospica acidiphila]